MIEKKLILQLLGIVLITVFAGVGIYQGTEWLSYTQDRDFINSIDQKVAVYQNIKDDTRMDIYQFNPMCPGNVSKWIITDDESKIKCGNKIQYEWKTYVVYEKFYGEDENITNTQKRKSISIDKINNTYDCSYNVSYNTSNGTNITNLINKTCVVEDRVEVSKSLQHYKGRQSVIADDFEERYIATEDQVKLNYYLNSRHTSKNIVKLCFSRFDDSIIKFDGLEEYKIEQEGSKTCYYYGYKEGDLFIDPVWSHDLPQRNSSEMFLYPNAVSSASEMYGVTGYSDGTFDGTSDYIRDVTALNNDFTISMWAKPADVSAGDKYLISFQNDYNFKVVVDNGEIQAIGKVGTTNYDKTGGSISTDKWYHILVTKDSTNGLKLYIDNTEITTFDTNNGDSATGNFDAQSIGNTNTIGSTPTPTNYYSGEITNALIYDDVLNQTEITNLYDAGRLADIETDANLVYNNTLRETFTKFDGTNDYTTTTLTGASDTLFTFNTWVKWDDSTAQTRLGLIGNNIGSVFSGFYIEKSTGYVRSYIASSTSSYSILNTQVSTSAIPQDTWTMVTIQRNGDTIKVYLNGVLDKTTTGAGTYDSSVQKRVIGSCDTRYYLKGSMSNFQIWDEEISSTEISDIYALDKNGAINTTDPNLVYYNPLDSLSDLSSNGNSGIANNGVIVTNNTSFDFDGTDDYINIGNPGITSTDWTFSAWINPDTNYPAGAGGIAGQTGDVNIFAIRLGKLMFFDGGWKDSGLAITANTWQFVTFAKTGTTMNFYVDESTSSLTVSNNNLNYDTNVGSFFSGTYYNGEISNILILNKTLNSTEVNDTYALGRVNYYAEGGDTGNAPVMINSSITPVEPQTSQDLLGFCNASDADLDNVRYYYKWYNGSVIQSSGVTGYFNQSVEINIANISSSLTSGGENWTLECTANDGTLNSTALNSTPVTIIDFGTIDLNVEANIIELGTSVYINASNSGTVCIDVDHPDLGVNVSCGDPVNITLIIEDYSDDEDSLNRTEFNLTFSGLSDTVSTDVDLYDTWIEDGTSYNRYSRFSTTSNNVKEFFLESGETATYSVRFLPSLGAGMSASNELYIYNYSSNIYELLDSDSDSGNKDFTLTSTVPSSLDSDYIDFYGRIRINLSISYSASSGLGGTSANFLSRYPGSTSIDDIITFNLSRDEYDELSNLTFTINQINKSFSNTNIYLGSELYDTITTGKEGVIVQDEFEDGSTIGILYFNESDTKSISFKIPKNANLSNSLVDLYYYSNFNYTLTNSDMANNDNTGVLDVSLAPNQVYPTNIYFSSIGSTGFVKSGEYGVGDSFILPPINESDLTDGGSYKLAINVGRLLYNDGTYSGDYDHGDFYNSPYYNCVDQLQIISSSCGLTNNRYDNTADNNQCTNQRGDADNDFLFDTNTCSGTQVTGSKYTLNNIGIRTTEQTQPSSNGTAGSVTGCNFYYNYDDSGCSCEASFNGYLADTCTPGTAPVGAPDNDLLVSTSDITGNLISDDAYLFTYNIENSFSDTVQLNYNDGGTYDIIDFSGTLTQTRTFPTMTLTGIDPSVTSSLQCNSTSTCTNFEAVNFTELLEFYLSICTADNEGFCTFDFFIESEGQGTYEFRNLNVSYTAGENQVTVTSEDLEDAFPIVNGTRNIQIGVSGSNDIKEISNIDMRYLNGETNISITAHNIGYTVTNSTNLTYVYSKTDLTQPPRVDYIWFQPKSGTDTDVIPFGQSDTKPILNFTYVNPFNRSANFSTIINMSIDCVNLTISKTNNKSDGVMFNQGTAIDWYQYDTGKYFNESTLMWMWADFSCTTNTWRFYDPQWYFRTCCSDCLCSEEVN